MRLGSVTGIRELVEKRERHTGDDDMRRNIGYLAVLERADKSDNCRRKFYWCKCICGNVSIFEESELSSGNVHDCGCGISAGKEQAAKFRDNKQQAG